MCIRDRPITMRQTSACLFPLKKRVGDTVVSCCLGVDFWDLSPNACKIYHSAFCRRSPKARSGWWCWGKIDTWRRDRTCSARSSAVFFCVVAAVGHCFPFDAYTSYSLFVVVSYRIFAVHPCTHHVRTAVANSKADSLYFCLLYTSPSPRD